MQREGAAPAALKSQRFYELRGPSRALTSMAPAALLRGFDW